MSFFDSPEEEKAKRLQELHNRGEQEEAEGDAGFTYLDSVFLSSEEKDAYNAGVKNTRDQKN